MCHLSSEFCYELTTKTDEDGQHDKQLNFPVTGRQTPETRAEQPQRARLDPIKGFGQRAETLMTGHARLFQGRSEPSPEGSTGSTCG